MLLAWRRDGGAAEETSEEDWVGYLEARGRTGGHRASIRFKHLGCWCASLKRASHSTLGDPQITGQVQGQHGRQRRPDRLDRLMSESESCICICIDMHLAL